MDLDLFKDLEDLGSSSSEDEADAPVAASPPPAVQPKASRPQGSAGVGASTLDALMQDLQSSDDDDDDNANNDGRDAKNDDADASRTGPHRAGTGAAASTPAAPSISSALDAAALGSHAALQPLTATAPSDPLALAKVTRSAQLARQLERIAASTVGSSTVPPATSSSSTSAPSASAAVAITVSNDAMDMDAEQTFLLDIITALTHLETELLAVYRLLCGLYEPRFSELAALVAQPIDYARVVHRIGNRTDVGQLDLRSLVPQATAMIITVTAASSAGRRLSDAELARVNAACEVLFDINAKRDTILAYVESRMSHAAPNLSALVGTRIAAKLMGACGGLAELAKVPACNLQVVGRKRHNTALSAAGETRHVGFLFDCDLVQNAPPEIRKKVLRTLAAKAALAARMDVVHANQRTPAASGDLGGQGRAFRDEVASKAAKLVEPLQLRAVKPLPAPIEQYAKKRGGRRARAAKARMAQSELQQAQSRRAFGVAEDEVLDGGGETFEGLGMVTTGGKLAGSGRMRALLATRRVGPGAALKRLKGVAGMTGKGPAGAGHLGPRGAGTATSLMGTGLGGTVTAAGSATSLAFGSRTGIQLAPSVIPGAGADTPSAHRLQAAESRWFGPARRPPPLASSLHGTNGPSGADGADTTA